MLPTQWSFLSVAWLMQETGPLLSQQGLSDQETTLFDKEHPVIFLNLLPKFQATV